MRSSILTAAVTLSFALPSGAAAPIDIAEIIDETGDGVGKLLDFSFGVAVDSSDNVYVVGGATDNVFRITPGGSVTEIIDATGDGAGNALSSPRGIAVDSSDNVYVTGADGPNAFKIATPSTCSTTGTPCMITEIINATGDGAGNTLSRPVGIAVDSSDNVYVAGLDSDNTFKIATPGACSTAGTPCTITEIIDATGDGAGNLLNGAYGVDLDPNGNVYVTGNDTDNTFKIATPGTCSTTGTPCTISEIIDVTGDGVASLSNPTEVAADSGGNIYVMGDISHNAFKISTPGTCSTIGISCTITEIIAEGPFFRPAGVAVDSSDNIFIANFGSSVHKITPGGTVTVIMDSLGDGAGKRLDAAVGVAVDSSDNVYVTGRDSDNTFKIATPGTCSISGAPCTITEIIDATGDGAGLLLDHPARVAVDASGNVYVTGTDSDSAFKVTPGGTVTEIIDATGDGAGKPLDYPSSVAVDASGNVYVTGRDSDNAFQITPGGIVTEIIDATGDGAGKTMDSPRGVAVDSNGNVYVTGGFSANAFEIATPGTCSTSGTPCTITEIIDSTGDGSGNTLTVPQGIAVDSGGNVYLVGVSGNAFKIAPGGAITEIIDNTGDGAGNTLVFPLHVAVDSSGNVYVTGAGGPNTFKIATPGTCSTIGTLCTITEIIDLAGDGAGHMLRTPTGVAAGASGIVYVSGDGSVVPMGDQDDFVFQITPGGEITVVIGPTGDGAGNMLFDPQGIAVDSDGNVYVTGNDTDCRGQAGFHNFSEYPCGNAFKVTLSGWVLYDRDNEEIARFATLADLIANQSFAGAESIAPTGFESLASDGTTWVLFDTDTDEISRYASLADLIAGIDIAGLEAIVPTGFEGIASDGAVWVLYNSNNERISRYASLADLIAGNDIAGLEAIVPTGFEEIASNGETWVLYDADTEEISRYATLADLIAGSDIAGLEPITPTGFESIAAVPEPGQLLVLVSGMTALLVMRLTDRTRAATSRP